MRPAVKRRLFTLAAAASLVLCVATVGLWVRSYWWRDGLTLRLGMNPDYTATSLSLVTGKGGVRLSHHREGEWVARRLVPMVDVSKRWLWVGSGGAPYYPYHLGETIVKGAGFELSVYRHTPRG